MEETTGQNEPPTSPKTTEMPPRTPQTEWLYKEVDPQKKSLYKDIIRSVSREGLVFGDSRFTAICDAVRMATVDENIRWVTQKISSEREKGNEADIETVNEQIRICSEKGALWILVHQRETELKGYHAEFDDFYLKLLNLPEPKKDPMKTLDNLRNWTAVRINGKNDYNIRNIPPFTTHPDLFENK